MIFLKLQRCCIWNIFKSYSVMQVFRLYFTLGLGFVFLLFFFKSSTTAQNTETIVRRNNNYQGQKDMTNHSHKEVRFRNPAGNGSTTLTNNLNAVSRASGSQTTNQTLRTKQSTTPTSMLNSSPAHYFNPLDYNYIIENKGMCAGYPVYILFIVQCAADHFSIRDKIRKTWASVAEYGGHRLLTVFMLAKPANKSLQQHIEHESNTYMDIVQMDFNDHYRNLSLKHLMSFGWISAHCNQARYVVKVDDDTLVNVYELVDFLVKDTIGAPITKHIYCSVYGHMVPRRERNNKWYVSKEEYPYDKYPPYCEGFAYITGTAVTNALYKAAPLVPLYWIDDVYVTGILVQKQGLGHRQFHQRRGYTLTGRKSCQPDSVGKTLFQLQKSAYYAIDWVSCWDIMTAAAAAAHPAYTPPQYLRNNKQYLFRAKNNSSSLPGGGRS